MTAIELTEKGLTLPALVAGDKLSVAIAADAQVQSPCRIVVSGPIRGGASALLAVSGPVQAGGSAQLDLATTQIRELFRALLPTDVQPVRVECISEDSAKFYAGSTAVLRNSALLWVADALPAESFAAGDTLAAIRKAIQTHEARRDNPHGVTEKQVRDSSSGARVFGALALDNVWTSGNLSGVAEVTTRIKAAHEEGGGLPLASVYHVTAADSGDGPAAYLSGVAKTIPAGTSSNVLLVFENNSAAPRTYTIFFDVWRTFSRGMLNEGTDYLPVSGLGAGDFALLPLTIWKLADGKVAVIVNDFIRTDWKDVYRFMTAKIFDESGNVWALVADSDGGMHTEPIS